MAGRDWFAHGPNDQGDWHPLKDHAEAVGNLAGEFASIFGAEEVARAAGLSHDAKMGEFQKYLRSSVAGITRRGTGPPHALQGALPWIDAVDPPCSVVATATACHHSGLCDIAELRGRLARARETPSVREEAPLFLKWLRQWGLPAPLSLPSTFEGKSLPLAIRMLTSTLLDADSLDTERHYRPQLAQKRAVPVASIEELCQLFEGHLSDLSSSGTQLNRLRSRMLRDVRAVSGSPRGLFSLTMPTSGGKTLASMAFALRHAVRNGQRRVITAIPACCTTEQNARVYREVAGARNLLEHHVWSMYLKEEDWHCLVAENWDARLVVTTHVQLLETLFSRNRRRLRKLHNVAGSVIVLDEVQAIPMILLDPTLDALKCLVEDFGCSVVFCTATQPPGRADLNVREIISDPKQYFRQLKRVQYDLSGLRRPWSFLELADCVREQKQAMVVLNTIGDARRLLVEVGPEALHMSGNMTGSHIREVLVEVHRRLAEGASVILISTQMVEFGLDLDFPVVFRAVAPLPNIIAAAGRCNREGRGPLGLVHVFELEGGGIPPGTYRTATEQTMALLQDILPGVVEDPETMVRYFRRVQNAVELDKKKIRASEERLKFGTTARKYKIIEDRKIAVLVRRPADQSEITRVIEASDDGPWRWKARALQPYLVSLWRKDFEEAREKGLIIPLTEEKKRGLPAYEWAGVYNELCGIVLT